MFFSGGNNFKMSISEEGCFFLHVLSRAYKSLAISSVNMVVNIV